MPIGKNAIKRVSSSNTAASPSKAENSVVAEPKVEEAVAPEVKEAPVQEVADTKEVSAAPKKKAPNKKSTKAAKSQAIAHYYLGDELPYYLL